MMTDAEIIERREIIEKIRSDYNAGLIGNLAAELAKYPDPGCTDDKGDFLEISLTSDEIAERRQRIEAADIERARNEEAHEKARLDALEQEKQEQAGRAIAIERDALFAEQLQEAQLTEARERAEHFRLQNEKLLAEIGIK